MRFWLRWSWRDLRVRWVQVAAIAAIVALGSGVYSGLSSTSTWRKQSYDASYERLNMYDLRVSLGTGSFIPPAALIGTVRSIPHSRWIDAVQARLILPTEVAVRNGDRTVLVPGRIVGYQLVSAKATIAATSVEAGRNLVPADSGRPVVTLDAHFAKHYSLPPRGTLRLGQQEGVRYVGQVLQPEYFIVTGKQGNPFAEATFAVVFTSLASAQNLTNHADSANDAVVTLAPGASSKVVQSELTAQFQKLFPNVGTSVTRVTDEAVRRQLYTSIGADQKLYTVFALLILAGAALTAFNLTSRMVEAQRREIGIGMALGTPPAKIAIRPLLVGGQVAVLGAVFGIGVGLILDAGMAVLLRDYLPLPVWTTTFQPAIFFRGAALGLVLPFLATVYPVWRAVRVQPVDAIRISYLRPSSRIATFVLRMPLPGKSLAQMPLRNVLRAPRRTVLTLTGIAAAITVLIGVTGMTDSFAATIDNARKAVLYQNPNRLSVGLDGFYPVSSPQVQAVAGSRLVGSSSPGLEIGGSLRKGGTSIDTLLELISFDRPIWVPPLTEGTLDSSSPAVVISQKAATDLHVSVNGTVILRHPRREGLTSYGFVNSPVRVSGIDPLPTRYIAFMDIRFAGIMNLQGITNIVTVVPARGISTTTAQNGLARLSGVSSVQPLSSFTDTVQQALAERLNVLKLVELVVLLLALLIAFNSTSIGYDERAREQATMFAFGLPVRTVITMAVAESLVIGVLGTLVGIAAGRILLSWLVSGLLASIVPEFSITQSVSGTTILAALGLGVLAVSVAPVLASRKQLRMDVPATLRVVE